MPSCQWRARAAGRVGNSLGENRWLGGVAAFDLWQIFAGGWGKVHEEADDIWGLA